jgi:hypothetical protein
LQTFVTLQVVPNNDDRGAKMFVHGIAYVCHLIAFGTAGKRRRSPDCCNPAQSARRP